MAIEYGKFPCIVTLQGELGAGKTTFTKAFAKKLGITESVASPTFVILKKYPIPMGSFFHNLIHIDAYRLENGEELEKIGFKNFIKNSPEKNIICIEWPEIVEEVLSPNRLAIKFEHMQNHTDNSEMRKVTIEQKM
jgi:tRNA threonylcarbamoyladenosine biosynthesis protein TsaE